MIKLIVMFLVYLGLIYLLSKIFKDFVVKADGIVYVAIALTLTDFLLYRLLNIVAYLPKVITFGFFNIFVDWAVNILIVWLADKFSDSLEIKNTIVLIICGALLAVARWVVGGIIT